MGSLQWLQLLAHPAHSASSTGDESRKKHKEHGLENLPKNESRYLLWKQNTRKETAGQQKTKPQADKNTKTPDPDMVFLMVSLFIYRRGNEQEKVSMLNLGLVCNYYDLPICYCFFARQTVFVEI